jgi:DNA (cytosine-5)-methyltransferase 1
MNHASLFSGIGGFDLAAEWTGWDNVFNCEWEEFPRKVLKHHFPNAKQYEDIKDFNATQYHGRIDVLSGGFPCQPFSVAGQRKGTEDDRHLWPEMLRVIGECQPRWVVGENVRGLVSWSDGLVLETCYSDLENLGYSVQSFIIPACATGAPHRRDRVWIVAHNHNGNGNAPNTDSERRHDENEWKRQRTKVSFANSKTNTWQEFPTVSPICGGDDGLPKELDGITFSKWRMESIKAYGNAIVPQVAQRIFESIQQYENEQP